MSYFSKTSAFKMQPCFHQLVKFIRNSSWVPLPKRGTGPGHFLWIVSPISGCYQQTDPKLRGGVETSHICQSCLTTCALISQLPSLTIRLVLNKACLCSNKRAAPGRRAGNVCHECVRQTERKHHEDNAGKY